MKRAAWLVLAGMVGLVTMTGGATHGAEPARFTSAKQAHDEWARNPDAASRRAAFDWLRANAQSCPLKALPDALAQFGRAALAAGSRDAFLEVCATRAAAATDPLERQAVAFAQSDWHAAAGEYEAAVATLDTYLKSPAPPVPQRAAAVVRLVALQADALGKPNEAVARATAFLATIAPLEQPAAYAEAANARAAVLHLHLRDHAGAEGDCRRVVELGKACPQPAYLAAVDRLAAVLTDGGKTNEAADALLLAYAYPLPPPAGTARKLIDAGASKSVLEEAVTSLRRRLAGASANAAELQASLDKIQPELIELVLGLGRPEEAVKECRVFALGASDRAYPQAIELGARCLKTLDGHLGRANALLDFHATAPLPPEVRNPLFDFPVLTDAVRAESLARAGTPITEWTGWINRAAHLSWLDRPVDAMEAARAAFAACPMASNSLQACANAVTRPILVASRNPELAQKVADYLLTGPAGVDGAIGTSDDLSDPFPECRRLLSYPSAQGRASSETTK